MKSSNILLVIKLLSLGVIGAYGVSSKAAVFGGGPAGLTTALELKEAGFDVELYEQHEKLGGKLKSYLTGKNLPWEHSIRIYVNQYLAFGDLFSRIGLQPPTSTNPDSTLTFKKRFSVLWSQTGFAFNSTEKFGKMLEYGFSPLEFYYFIFQLTAWQQVDAPTRNALNYVTFKDFIDGFAFAEWQIITNCSAESVTTYCFAAHTKEFHLFLQRTMSTIMAAIPEDSVPGVMWVFVSIYKNLLLPTSPECEPYYEYFPNSYVASGPTSFKVINPWVSYLEGIGVKIMTEHTLSELDIDEITGSINKAIVKRKKGSKLEVIADVYVMAMPVDNAELLVPGVSQGTQTSTKWSAGIQFYLPCLPDTWSFYHNQTLMTSVNDGPLDVIYMLESPVDGAWEGANFTLKEGIEFALSVAVSNFEAPGVLYNKSFLESSKEEALEEILYEIGFPDSVACPKGKPFTKAKLIKNARLGVMLEDLKEWRYQKKKDKKYKTYSVGPLKDDGRRWVLESPLYIPTPSALPVSTITDHDNLFLAGEFVATPLVVMPTVEKVAESGKLAAQAAVEFMGMNYKVPMVDLLLDLVNATTVAEYSALVKNGTIIGKC